jgi:Cu+-exporting ATPase
MKIGLVEKILIALSISVVLGSFAFAVNARPAADQVAVLKTLGMTCASCAGKIEQTLKAVPGVAEVTVDIAAARVTAAYAANTTTPEVLAEAITAAGYRSGVVQSLPLAQYRQLVAQQGAAGDVAKKSGCGSSCCNK